MLLPEPWVCQTTPPLCVPPGREALTTWRIAAPRVELMIAGDLFHQATVILEQHEVTQVIQQQLRRHHTAQQGLQFVELTQRIELFAVDGAPVHKAFGISRQRAHACLAAI